jgi:hypothetical protein
MLNAQYHKNQNYDEIKTHHYLISFDPADKDECGLTGEQAQAIGMEYVKANFPGHQALVCTHMDGHNGSGNIHVHIVINSLRKLDVPQQPFMERPIDCKAGYKHHLTKDYLKYLQQHPNYRHFYHRLQRAGGNNTALTGDAQFKSTWADLSKNSDFLQSQQDFIVAKKLDPALRRISDIKGLNLEYRSLIFCNHNKILLLLKN